MKNNITTRHTANALIGLALILCLSVPPTLNAQVGQGLSTAHQASQKQKVRKEHRFDMSSGKLKLDLFPVVIEGYEGREVIISTLVEVLEVEEMNDPRAAGLVNLSNLGNRNKEDNTGVGLSKSVHGEVTTIQKMKPLENDTVYLRIPRQLDVEVMNSRSFWMGGDISIKDVVGEVEVSQTHGNVMLLNVTGPTTVQAIQGNIEAVFSQPVRGPISLVSNFGFVDVTLPAQTKADMEMSTMMGEIFADESLQIVREDSNEGDSIKKRVLYLADSTGRPIFHSNGSAYDRFGSALSLSGRINLPIKGKLNGGGDPILLRSIQGKIYLRRAD